MNFCKIVIYDNKVVYTSNIERDEHFDWWLLYYYRKEMFTAVLKKTESDIVEIEEFFSDEPERNSKIRIFDKKVLDKSYII